MPKWISIAREFPDHKIFLSGKKSFRKMAKKDPSGRIIVQLFSDIIFRDNWQKSKTILNLAKKSFITLDDYASKSFIKHTYNNKIKTKVFMALELIEHYKA